MHVCIYNFLNNAASLCCRIKCIDSVTIVRIVYVSRNPYEILILSLKCEAVISYYLPCEDHGIDILLHGGCVLTVTMKSPDIAEAIFECPPALNCVWRQ